MVLKRVAELTFPLFPPNFLSTGNMCDEPRQGGRKEQDGWGPPPQHTLTLTMSWPQLTLQPLSSLTSYWLGLKRAGLRGFMAEKRRKAASVPTSILVLDKNAKLHLMVHASDKKKKNNNYKKTPNWSNPLKNLYKVLNLLHPLALTSYPA